MESNYTDTRSVFVRPINSNIAKELIIKYHYTHKSYKIRFAFGVFYKTEENPFFSGDNEELIGAITYGHPVGFRVVDSIVTDDSLGHDNVLELTRLYIHDGYGKNIESYVIGQTFRWLRKNAPEVKVLVSYADPEYGHLGKVYQATNWIYQGCGQSKLMEDYSVRLSPDDVWLHSRGVGQRWGEKNIHKLAKTIGKTFWRKQESPKHRYIYFLCDKKERKQLMSHLKLQCYPYSAQKDFSPTIERIEVDKDGNIVQITREQ